MRRRATDHRAIVLEAVATHPHAVGPFKKDILDAVVAAVPSFKRAAADSMMWQLVKEGLIGLKEDGKTYFITKAGLDWLTYGVFDRALPAEHERPRARKPRRRKSDPQ